MAKHYIKSDKPNKQFLVQETETEQVIGLFKDYEAAKKYSKFLNNGGAFAGVCPPFMLKGRRNGYVR